MSETATRRRGRGTGGGAARRAERTAVRIEAARYIERRIPNLPVLDDEAMEIIEANAETLLEEIGVVFSDNPGALQTWREAGADIQGDRVHIPKGLARRLCSTAPSRFTQHARNPTVPSRSAGGPSFWRRSTGRPSCATRCLAGVTRRSRISAPS